MSASTHHQAPDADGRTPLTGQLDLHDDPAVRRRGKRPPEPLTLDEVRRLMAAPSRRSSAGVRDRAMIAVGLRGGLRLAEMLDLEVRDVDLDALTIRVRHGKGDRARAVAIDATTREFIAAWLDRRATLIGRRKAPLFCTFSAGRPPGRQDDSYVRKTLRRYGQKAGITRKVHPHGLRHTFTVTAVREGVSLAALQMQLGHSDLRTTTVYVRGLDPAIDLAPLRDREWDLS